MHGYGGGSALFFPILKRLAEWFDIILLDIIGQAGSSRPLNYDIENITPQESIDYFVNYFEKWRKMMKFILHNWRVRLENGTVKKNLSPEEKA